MSFLGLHTNLRCPPKWQENNCEEKSPDDRRYPGVNVFLHLMQKFKMAVQICGKTVFGKNRQMTFRLPRRSKFCQNLSISHPFHEKCVFAFNAEIQDGRPNLRENCFWEKSPDDFSVTPEVKILSKSLNLSPLP